MFDGLDAKRGGDVGLARAWSADQYDIVGAADELATVQLADQGFARLAGSEVEACQILVGRKPGGLDQVGDRPDLAFGKLGLEQLERMGTAVSKAGAPCSMRSLTAWAMPCIFRERSMTTTAALAGS